MAGTICGVWAALWAFVAARRPAPTRASTKRMGLPNHQ